MNLAQAVQAPIVVELGGVPLAMPRFLLSDFVRWGADLDAQRRRELTEGMTPGERVKTLLYLDVRAIGIDELASLVYTPAGTRRVLVACFRKTAVTQATAVRKVLAARLLAMRAGEAAALAPEGRLSAEAAEAIAKKAEADAAGADLKAEGVYNTLADGLAPEDAMALAVALASIDETPVVPAGVTAGDAPQQQGGAADEGASEGGAGADPLAGSGDGSSSSSSTGADASPTSTPATPASTPAP